MSVCRYTCRQLFNYYPIGKFLKKTDFELSTSMKTYISNIIFESFHHNCIGELRAQMEMAEVVNEEGGIFQVTGRGEFLFCHTKIVFCCYCQFKQ